MKFKDLKVGQMFTRQSWARGRVNVKIKKETFKGVVLTHKNAGFDGVKSGHLRDGDDVILIQEA